jgi:hypothetical protein
VHGGAEEAHLSKMVGAGRFCQLGGAFFVSWAGGRLLTARPRGREVRQRLRLPPQRWPALRVEVQRVLAVVDRRQPRAVGLQVSTVSKRRWVWRGSVHGPKLVCACVFGRQAQLNIAARTIV